MKKTLLLAAVACAALSANADWYVIGDNVNGNSWQLAAPDAKMEAKGDGIYEITIETLGTGFKFNDGTWNGNEQDGVVANIGSNGDPLTLGEPYYFEANGSSGNIGYAGEFTTVKNAHIVLNITEGTVTVTGEASGQLAWYLVGGFNSWAMGDDNAKMEEVDGKLVKKGLVMEMKEATTEDPTPNTFKIARTGYSVEYGYGKAEDAELSDLEVLDADHLRGTLWKGGANQPYDLTGTYDVEATFSEDGTTALIVFTAAGEGGVDGVDVDENAPVYYYNMQGVRVDNPTSGVYVKVRGEKAEKVLVAE